MKFVEPLTPAEQVTLQEALKYGPSARVRQRAHAIYLSSKGFKIPPAILILTILRQPIAVMALKIHHRLWWKMPK